MAVPPYTIIKTVLDLILDCINISDFRSIYLSFFLIEIIWNQFLEYNYLLLFNDYQ